MIETDLHSFQEERSLISQDGGKGGGEAGPLTGSSEGYPSGLAVHNAHCFQHAQGLAQAGPADAQPLGQFPFGGKAVPRSQFSRC